MQTVWTQQFNAADTQEQLKLNILLGFRLGFRLLNRLGGRLRRCRALGVRTRLGGFWPRRRGLALVKELLGIPACHSCWRKHVIQWLQVNVYSPDLVLGSGCARAPVAQEGETVSEAFRRGFAA